MISGVRASPSQRTLAGRATRLGTGDFCLFISLSINFAALSPVRSDRHTLWQALALALARVAWQCVWL